MARAGARKWRVSRRWARTSLASSAGDATRTRVPRRGFARRSSTSRPAGPGASRLTIKVVPDAPLPVSTTRSGADAPLSSPSTAKKPTPKRPTSTSGDLSVTNGRSRREITPRGSIPAPASQTSTSSPSAVTSTAPPRAASTPLRTISTMGRSECPNWREISSSRRRSTYPRSIGGAAEIGAPATRASSEPRCSPSATRSTSRPEKTSDASSLAID